jgi:flagellar protein FlaG
MNLKDINTLASPMTSMPLANSDIPNKNAVAVSKSQVSNVIKDTESKPSDVAKFAEPTRQVIDNAAKVLQEFVASMGRNLEFTVDHQSGYHVVRVTDPITGDLVRQLPSKELLMLSRSMATLQNGLVNQKA